MSEGWYLFGIAVFSVVAVTLGYFMFGWAVCHFAVCP